LYDLNLVEEPEEPEDQGNCQLAPFQHSGAGGISVANGEKSGSCEVA
jgi:hypothetical protein